MNENSRKSGTKVPVRSRSSDGALRSGWAARLCCFGLLVSTLSHGAGAFADMPGIGPVSLGGDPGAGIYGSKVRHMGFEGVLLFERMPDLSVSHLVFLPERDAGDPEAVEPPELDRVARRMTEALGVALKQPGPLHFVWAEPTWSYVYELEKVPAAGGASELRMVLRTLDPSRTCGEADGFAPFHERLRAAILNGDEPVFLSAFDYPFLDQAAVVMDLPAVEHLHFEDADALRNRLDDAPVQAFLAQLASALVDCDPVGREGHAGGYRMLVENGAVQALRRAGGWRLTLRYYLP